MAAPVSYVLSERALDGGGELLSVEGATNAAAADWIRKRAEDAVGKSGRTLVVDLSRVSFVDSAVVQSLGDVAATAKKRGGRLLVIEPVDPMIARPLEMGRLDLVAEIHPTLDHAARALKMPAGSLQSALPAPAPPPEPANRPRRAMFGRRGTDQEILRELGHLRRLAQELRRESGLYQQASAGEIDRRRAAEAELLSARESAARAADAPEIAEALAKAREQLEAAQAHAHEARREADRMDEEAETAHERIQALEKQVEVAREETAALQRDLENVRSQLDAAQSEADRMEEEAEDAHGRIQVLEADLEAARGRILLLETQNAELQAPESAPTVTPAEPTPEAPPPESVAATEPIRTAAVQPEPSPHAEAPAAPGRDAIGNGPRPLVPVWADPRPINLNTADVEELMLLPGIGRRPAERILAARQAQGGFKRVDDLYEIKEIPRDRLVRIRQFVSI